MISVIIPVYNQHELTQECIRSVMRQNTDLEIIIVDNGSHPGYVNKRMSTFVIRNESNLGFPRAINQGISVSNGDIICILNNDTILPRITLEKLLHFLDIANFDIVGPVSNYVAGVQKVTVPEYTDITSLENSAWKNEQDNFTKVLPVNFIIGFCMMFRRSTFDDVGPFDESLWPCSGEEIDWCFRARGLDYNIGVAMDTYIHHFGSQTFNDLQRQGQLSYQEICNRNDKHIAERWGEGFWQRQLM